MYMFRVKRSGRAGPMSLGGQKDGGWGWVVVAATFLLWFIMDGLMYSNGILYLELLDEFQRGQGETAWVISLQGAVRALSSKFIRPTQKIEYFR